MQYRHPSIASQTSPRTAPLTLSDATGPNFAVPLVENGYAWWYVDASSDCGRYGLTLIAMLGCVFSPWYARARRQGPVNPLNHSACNLALYGPDGRRWAMTERGQSAVTRDRHQLMIGPSALRWQDGALEVEINEKTAPWPRPLQGRLRITPERIFEQAFLIDEQGRHRWTPIAPQGRIEVDWAEPNLRWQGHAYFDGNHGDAPLEHDFLRWQWSRAHDGQDSWIFYDTDWRNGGHGALALRMGADGAITPLSAPPWQVLRTTPWGIARAAHCDPEQRAQVLRTLEDGPFYARSWIESTIAGKRMRAWHESVSLTRFASRWVQVLLPVRLPRATR